MSTLRIGEGDWIEFEDMRIARLEPGLAPSLVGRLAETFEEIDDSNDDAGYITHLEDRVAALEKQLKQGSRT